jgi:hypothetical protein
VKRAKTNSHTQPPIDETCKISQFLRVGSDIMDMIFFTILFFPTLYVVIFNQILA